MGSQNRLAGSQCMQAKRSMRHRAEMAGVADGHHLPAVDDVWDGTMGLKADPEALMLLFGRVSWAFLQVRRLESLLFCRLSGTRLRPGFRLPISSVRTDIFCFDPLMARGRASCLGMPSASSCHRACRQKAAACRKLARTCRHGSPQQDCAVQALQSIDCRHLPAVQCKTGGRIVPGPEPLARNR